MGCGIRSKRFEFAGELELNCKRTSSIITRYRFCRKVFQSFASVSDCTSSTYASVNQQLDFPSSFQFLKRPHCRKEKKKKQITYIIGIRSNCRILIIRFFCRSFETLFINWLFNRRCYVGVGAPPIPLSQAFFFALFWNMEIFKVVGVQFENWSALQVFITANLIIANPKFSNFNFCSLDWHNKVSDFIVLEKTFSKLPHYNFYHFIYI